MKDSLVLYWTQIAIYNISQSLVSHKIQPPYNHWSFVHYSPKFTEITYRTEIPTVEQIASILNSDTNALVMCHHGGNQRWREPTVCAFGASDCQRSWLYGAKFQDAVGNPFPTLPSLDREAFNEGAKPSLTQNPSLRERGVAGGLPPPAAIHCYVTPPTALRTEEKVSRQFLSILYSHPQMKETIPIELDAAIYLVGNEILSAAFVERYLTYQSRPYVFDVNYKLELMNKKIQMFEMDSSQYVVLNKTGYLIV